MSVPVSQLLLEKDLERFGELLGDVRKGDVLHPAGFDELPEVKLRGLRLAVGGGGIDLLGADPEPFAFHLSGLQEVFRHGIGTGYGGLEQLGRDHSLVPQQVPVRLFQPASEGGKAVVLPGCFDFTLLAVPVSGFAIDACRDSRFLSVDADPAEDGGCTAPQKLDTFGVFFMKYNYEIRLKAVKLVLEGGLSVREAGCHLGCGRSQVHLWVTLFERHGLAGLKLRHGSYSAEFKLSVLKHMHQNHLSLLETAVHFGIPGPFVIRQWERLYQNQGAEGLRRKPQRRRPAMSKSKTKKVKLKTTPHEELLKELEYLRAENAYLKKLQALVEERIVRESGKEPKPSKD